MSRDWDRDRCKCGVCDWVGTYGDLLRAPSPFDPDDEIAGCPACKAVQEFPRVCDTPGCTEWASCGTQTPAGYRHTCGEHRPKD